MEEAITGDFSLVKAWKADTSGTYTHTHTHTYIHTYILKTHTHTHIHTQATWSSAALPATSIPTPPALGRFALPR
jgi:acyl CoA:acetate/3-ketoacid CoA transferase alpha subunit